ncbi:MAG TPA: methyltransferase [Gemmatimonadaceae bacterium]|nr:methyltransferase [Gemmatimonadaceae bacterium]
MTSRERQSGRRAAAPRASLVQLESLLLFARNFVKHPLMLGSAVPSSRYLIEHLVAPVAFDRARVVVEYGPGVGPITAALLQRMRPDASLVALEVNAELAAHLRAVVRDPRLHVVHASAERADDAIARLKLPLADYVVSGIPFSTMPAATRQRVVRVTRAVLQPTGVFIVYQFSRAVLPDLRATFAEVREDFEPRNLPPARLFYCAV